MSGQWAMIIWNDWLERWTTIKFFFHSICIHFFCKSNNNDSSYQLSGSFSVSFHWLQVNKCCLVIETIFECAKNEKSSKMSTENDILNPNWNYFSGFSGFWFRLFKKTRNLNLGQARFMQEIKKIDFCRVG